MLCQATRSEIATVEVASQSDDGPYYLCASAAERLKSCSLRPLEWYNLAVIHGPDEFYLHDDFYNDEGVADQPGLDVLDSEHWPMPTLDVVRTDIDALIDYATTRWSLTTELTEALSEFRAEDLLRNLKLRYLQKRSSWFHQRFDSIIAEAVGAIAESFLIDRLNRLPPIQRLATLSLAGSVINRDLAIDLGLSALAQVDVAKRVPMLRHLGEFRSVRVLDWIEANVHDPLTQEWGELAACSEFSWPVARRWIEMGRPHSLIALDALLFCRTPRPSDSGLVKEIRPKLIDNPSAADMSAVLRRYRDSEHSPRIEQRVGQILTELVDILLKP